MNRALSHLGLFPFQVSVPYSLRNMRKGYLTASLKVCYCSGNLEDSAICAHREMQVFHNSPKPLHRFTVRLGKLLHHPLCHLGVAMYLFILRKALLLHLSGLCNTLANLCAALFPMPLCRKF